MIFEIASYVRSFFLVHERERSISSCRTFKYKSQPVRSFVTLSDRAHLIAAHMKWAAFTDQYVMQTRETVAQSLAGFTYWRQEPSSLGRNGLIAP